ncbi:hypothetical protein AB8O38_19510 [Saccharomonospora xinjiangensis]|uniref:hypothetical protein n=1 Tax=Saccharomonospora xinjiangensis TaxID=75294 RepID=UPI00350ECBC6
MRPRQKFGGERDAVRHVGQHVEAVEGERALAVLAPPPQGTPDDPRALLGEPGPLGTHPVRRRLFPELIGVHEHDRITHGEVPNCRVHLGRCRVPDPHEAAFALKVIDDRFPVESGHDDEM